MDHSDARHSQGYRKEHIGLLIGPILAGLLYVFLPPSLSPSARTLSAILMWVVVYWISEPIPIPITALLGTALCVLTGLGSMKSVFSAYAHPIIFLIIGSLFLAEALKVHGLDRRFGIWLLSIKWVGLHPVRISLALGCAVAGLSMWISNTAATAVMVPIALGILRTLRGSQEGSTKFNSAFLLLIAYSAAIGGMTTIIGTPPNLIGVALLSEQADINISFGMWVTLGLPLGVLMLLVLYLRLLWFLPPGLATRSGAILPGQQASLGQWSWGERNACLGFSFAVILWIIPGILSAWLGTDHAIVAWVQLHLPKELVPIVAAGLLFLLPVDLRQRTFTLSWRQAVNINWGIILMLGGGIAFGQLMVETQLAYTIGESLIRWFGVQSVWGLTAMAILASMLLTQLTSNTATASMIVPVVIAIAQTAEVSPLPPTLGACMGASLAFVLPVSTAPNAIVYGTGYIPITSMIRFGMVLNLIGGIVIWLTLWLLCPLIGLSH